MVDTSLVFNVLARDKASQVFGKISGAATAAGATVGIALGAGITQAIQQAKVGDRLKAQLGNAPWSAAAGKAAGALYADAYGESMQEAGDSVRAVLQSGLLGGKATAKEIENVTAKAMSLAKTFDQDVSATARAASQMIRTGLAKNSAEALDILTRGFQQTGDMAGDLLDTFSEYSTQFRKLGLSGAVATGLLTQGIKAGARDVDTVADTIKEFSIRAIDGSKATADGFELIGLNAGKMGAKIAGGGKGATQALGTVLDRLRAMEDPVKRDAAAVALFGTKAEDMGSALYALDPTTAVAALGKVKGAAGQLDRQLNDNVATALESLKRQGMKVFVGMMNQALPAIRQMVTWLQANKATIMQWIPFLVKAGLVLGGVAIAVKAVQFATAAWKALISVITVVTKAWTAAQWLLNVAMRANPIGIVITIIMVLVGIFILAWKKSETFRKIVTGAWNAIWGAVKAVGRWFKNTLWPWISGVFSNIVGAARSVWRGVTGFFGKMVDFVSGLPGRIANAVSGLWDGLTNGLKSALNWVIGKINDAIGFFNGLIGGVNRLPGVSIPYIPYVPYLARGGNVLGSGSAVVGENGPELLDLPKGARVTPLNGGGQQGGGVTTLRLEVGGSPSGLDRMFLTWLKQSLRANPGIRLVEQ